MRTLVAIPVFNEERYAKGVLERVLKHVGNVLVIDDGSTDSTPSILAQFPVDVIRHCVNRGYGQSLIDAFRFAQSERYDWIITMDCDEQHEPDRIPDFIDLAERSEHLPRHARPDIISGSRYLTPEPADDLPPPDRRAINAELTREINQRLGLSLTDAFCGFKAHRVSSLASLSLSESGYAFPMQLWVQAAAARLNIAEIAVRRIYVDPTRTFGQGLDNPAERLAHYRSVLHAEIRRFQHQLPAHASLGITPGQYSGR